MNRGSATPAGRLAEGRFDHCRARVYEPVLGRFRGTADLFRAAGGHVAPQACLYYYRARYYSPRLGRFLQTDPIGTRDDLNLYTYVGNDPADRTDPSGEFWNLVVGGGLGALSGAAYSAYVQYKASGDKFDNVSWTQVGVAAAKGAVIGVAAAAGGFAAAEAAAAKVGATAADVALAEIGGAGIGASMGVAPAKGVETLLTGNMHGEQTAASLAGEIVVTGLTATAGAGVGKLAGQGSAAAGASTTAAAAAEAVGGEVASTAAGAALEQRASPRPQQCVRQDKC